MEDQDYRYAVYVECSDPVEARLKKIQTYFQIRRKSGGGECGPLRRVKGHVFRVDFKHQNDQQAVLQRSQHVVDGLELKVRDHQEPQTSSPSQDPPAPVEVSKSFQEDSQPDQVSTTRRIVVVGKTGYGKSHLANTIFGEELFITDDTPNSGTSRCKAETRSVNGRSITLIDTPGFFDANRPEEQMKPEILKCIVECAPGPHAFLIVLKVEKYTKHEQAIIDKICEYFSPDVLKYAVIVFTHGDQLREGMRIEDFVNQNKNLKDLVRKCGGRCHVIDNKSWTKDQHEYRNNRVQVEKLLDTVEKMVVENNDGFYTNEMLQEVEKQIKKEEEQIKETSSGHMTPEEIRKNAKESVFNRFWIQLAGITAGALVGALFSVARMVGSVSAAMRMISQLNIRLGAGGAAGLAMDVIVESGAVVEAVNGGMIGYEEAQKAKTPWEAMKLAAKRVYNKK